MPYSVIFSPTSIRDLSDSVSYIARIDIEAAAKIGDGLIDRAESFLSRNPEAGPRCLEYEDTNIRYWLHKSYRIVYRVNEQTETIEILRFWHCARGDWPISTTD